MRYTSVLMIGISVLASGGAGAAEHRHKGHPRPAIGEQQIPGSFEPPRMIEVRPGQWTSTYDRCGDPCDSM
jgi:hypothetical protein